MTMLLLAPAFTFQWFATAVIVLAACAIVLWLLSKVPVPEPLNYVVYAGLALLALWILFGVLR